MTEREATPRSAFLDEVCPDDSRLRRKLGAVFDQVGPDAAAVGSSPFAVLDATTLCDLLSVMRPREYAPGEYLIRQGDPAEFLLLVLTGTASARVRGTPSNRPPVGQFGAGDIVGEMSLLTDEPRTADVVAETSVRALELSSVDFHRMTDRHPDLRVVLMKSAAVSGRVVDAVGGPAPTAYVRARALLADRASLRDQ